MKENSSYVAPDMKVLQINYERAILVDSLSQPFTGENPGTSTDWDGEDNWGL